MPRLPIRVLLFLSSYAPLLGLLAWRSRCTPWQWIALAAVATGSLVVLYLLMRMQRGHGDALLTIRAWRTKDSETLGYIATYLIPLLSLDLGRIDDVVALGVFGLVLGIVYCNSGLIYTNPMLNLMGYRVYEVEDPTGQSWTLVTKRKTLAGVREVQPARVGDSLVRLES